MEVPPGQHERNNSTTKWGEVYAEFKEEISDFVRARLPSHLAEEVEQDVWANFGRTLPQVSIDQPRAWLYRVARNRITDAYRSRAARPAFRDLDEAMDYFDPDDPSTGIDGLTLREAIEAALELLPPKQREVFERNELGGETLREIAGDLGVPLNTAISRKGYARRRLQEELQELYTEYFGEE